MPCQVVRSFFAAGADLAQSGGQVGEALQVVDRAEVVDVRMIARSRS
jgi:hypothetical protein